MKTILHLSFFALLSLSAGAGTISRSGVLGDNTTLDMKPPNFHFYASNRLILIAPTEWIVVTNIADRLVIEGWDEKRRFYRTDHRLNKDPLSDNASFGDNLSVSSNLVATITWKGKEHQVTLESIPFYSTNRVFTYEKVKKYK